MNSFDFWPGKVCPARQYFAPQSVWSRPKFMGKDDCVDESNYFPAPWYDLVRDLTRLMDVKVHKSRECQGAYNIGSFVWQGSIIDILVSCFLQHQTISSMGLESISEEYTFVKTKKYLAKKKIKSSLVKMIDYFCKNISTKPQKEFHGFNS